MTTAKLEKFKQRLLEKRQALLSGVKERSTTSMEGDGGIQDVADQASTAYTKEFLLSIGDQERRLLQQVDAALEKIRSDTYGQCEKCESEISEKRLEALPFAKYCIACQEEEEKRR